MSTATLGGRATTVVPQHASVEEFLTTASTGPAMLLVAGEAGIGKTTLWLAAAERAGELGVRVLSTRPSPDEGAYAALADLLAGVDAAAWTGPAGPQRLALDQSALRSSEFRGAIDHRAVSMAFLGLVVRLAQVSPVLLAIDGLPSLDRWSRDAVAFATRRLTGPVGVLATVDDGPGAGDPASWLRLPTLVGVQRITIGPLSIGALHAALRERLGRSFPRPTMAHIHRVSGGNPFYALELAATIADAPGITHPVLPPTLCALVGRKIGRLDTELHETLLAASCLSAPTVELLARATDTDTAAVMARLERAETTGIIEMDGHRIRFVHPMLGHGVYSGASAHRRRDLHGRLAEMITDPEQRARHLALACTNGSAALVRQLDEAAEIARRRGAPAAAAELLDLALGLGGDTGQRRIRCAGAHLAAGDLARARKLLESTIADLAPGPQRARALTMAASVRLLDDGALAATELLAQAIDEAGGELAAEVPALLAMAVAQATADDVTAAIASAEDAVGKAAQLGDPILSNRARGVRTALGVLGGHGVDERMDRDVASTDRRSDDAEDFQTSLSRALRLAWTGQLELARTEMRTLTRHSRQRGAEHELASLDQHAVMIELWRADLPAAAAIVADAMERAQQLGGDLPLAGALAGRAALAAFTGRVDDSRADAHAAVAICRRSGARVLANWTVGQLAFIEVSSADYHAALTTLEPLLARFDAAGGSHLLTASFVPDAVEALVGVGRLAEAEALVEQLETPGARMDRPWLLAVGARGRAMVLAARGDLGSASVTAARAMAEHERLPMPFERARTQLLLGQIQRRGRQRDASARTLQRALATFTELGTPLWAQRARAELDRSAIGARQRAALTPSERRVAGLTAGGMTNRDVAAALFISPKTVEANLARIYQKLGIRSRAELGRSMGHECSCGASRSACR